MAKKLQNKSPEKEMSFLDHLEDLRWHLIRICLAVVIVATFAFIFSRFIFDQIIYCISLVLQLSYSKYYFSKWNYFFLAFRRRNSAV